MDEFDIDIFKNILLIKEINSQIRRISAFENSVSIDLKYISLLNYPDSIKIDISFREKPLIELKEVPVHSPYFVDSLVLTFQIVEIASEKMRALIQRKRPRDYFDMWLLLKELEFKDFEKLAEKKLAAMNDNMDIGKVFTDLDIVKSLWKVDLEQLIPELPDFDGVMNDLKKKLDLH